MPKPKKIFVDVVITVPRQPHASMLVSVEIDPDDINLSDPPTPIEVTTAAENAAVDKLKFKLSSKARSVIKEIKAARKAKAEG